MRYQRPEKNKNTLKHDQNAMQNFDDMMELSKKSKVKQRGAEEGENKVQEEESDDHAP
jgi:hypothetical protein